MHSVASLTDTCPSDLCLQTCFLGEFTVSSGSLLLSIQEAKISALQPLPTPCRTVSSVLFYTLLTPFCSLCPCKSLASFHCATREWLPKDGLFWKLEGMSTQYVSLTSLRLLKSEVETGPGTLSGVGGEGQWQRWLAWPMPTAYSVLLSLLSNKILLWGGIHGSHLYFSDALAAGDATRQSGQ